MELLNELVAISDQLAAARGKQPVTPVLVPANPIIHPDVAAVIATGALGFQGVDPERMVEFTKDANSRGMRRKAIVFGWPRQGHTWFATPENYGDEASVLVINRLERLATNELSVSEFIELCIEQAKVAIDEVDAEPVIHDVGVTTADFTPPKLKGRRPVKVELIECDGGTVVADDRTEELTGEELSYIRWCMASLQLVTEGTAPDLSRWVSRCLRSCRIDAIPAIGDKNRALYDDTWSRLTRRDRAAPASVHHQVASWKFEAPGAWIIAPNEFLVLRRADMSTPPRHTPTAEQKAIWAKWMDLVKAEVVELHIR